MRVLLPVLAAVASCQANHVVPAPAVPDQPVCSKMVSLCTRLDVRVTLFGPEIGPQLVAQACPITCGCQFPSAATTRGSATTAKKGPGGRPNVYLFIADDLTFESKEDPAELRTPALDAFKKDGVVFTRMYTPSAMCAPARAVILTGMNPVRPPDVRVS